MFFCFKVISLHSGLSFSDSEIRWNTSCCSVPQSCLIISDPMTAACQASLSFTISRTLLKLMSVELVIPSNHLILCCPLLLQPPIFCSIRVFSNESALCIRWSKDWSFSFSISPSNEYSGLISFSIDWFDLLAAQGTFKSLLQNYSSSTLSVFFIVQLSHPFMTTGKPYLWLYGSLSANYCLFFNTLSRFVIGFLPRSKGLLIVRLQSPSAVIMKPKKIKSLTVSMFPHLFAMKWWDKMPWS